MTTSFTRCPNSRAKEKVVMVASMSTYVFPVRVRYKAARAGPVRSKVSVRLSFPLVSDECSVR
jgi:hypothetical protein